MGYDWISFTTDYGLDGGFTAACEGVIARIAPAARVLHVTHAVPAQDIRRGAVVLAQTVPSLPRAVHLAVVDPGVGTARRPIAVVTDNGVLVGPDNGLLVPAAEALGGITGAHELTEYRLEPVSATFHGRDIFAPAAAHLAAGVAPAALGPAVDPTTLSRLPAPTTVATAGRLTTEVLGTDIFGNLQLAATAADLAATGATLGTRVHAQVGEGSVDAVLGRTFADVPAGASVVLVDSAGHVAIAVNSGSAERVLTARSGDSAVLQVAVG
ncbi:SAM hydrolase/SAM-dependent halogenase family protein [Actinokineospora sp.]|uniref:SAM hydrolase/SAM-dependent halogenase family protein n=1 Tax=Actinokineospora sp. TaxID=1872133 RepID=UPI004037DE0F